MAIPRGLGCHGYFFKILLNGHRPFSSHASIVTSIRTIGLDRFVEFQSADLTKKRPSGAAEEAAKEHPREALPRATAVNEEEGLDAQ